MEEVFGRLAQLFTLAFAVTTMFSLGLGLTIDEILLPLRNWRFVAGAVVVSFVVVPTAAVLLAEVFGLEDDLRIGLVLIGSAAGAPMIPGSSRSRKGTPGRRSHSSC